MIIRRGEIYWVVFDPVKGSEQGGLRPAIIIQNDIGNRYSPTTVVAAITRTVPPQPYPFAVVVDPSESGLPNRCCINCAQLATIQLTGAGSRLRPPKGEFELRPIGMLKPDKMAEVDKALKFNLSLK
jgi:mRNA interferase MazF